LNIFKTAPLAHLKAIQALLLAYKAEASIDVASYVLEVRARNRYYRLFPQFLSTRLDRPSYTLTPDDNVRGFVGWRPYFNKRWPIGSGKFPFKEYCAARGLRTPMMSRRPADDLRDFVVKHASSSFGTGLRGPFKSYDPGNAAHALGEDCYYEAFVRGRIVKAFFWESRLGCIELLDMPTVTGDGRTKLRELISAKLNPAAPGAEWKPLAEIAAYQDLTLDSVPSGGQTVMVDFRYGSYLRPLGLQNSNALERLRGGEIERQLSQYGHALWEGIPEELRLATLFSLDAVVDDRDQVWLLEMNCNPVCHPDMYPMIFERLFGPRDVSEPAPQQHASPAARAPYPAAAQRPALVS
jgi:hypothetical protein